MRYKLEENFLLSHPSPCEIVSGIERIWRGQEALRYDVVSNFIEELYRREGLAGLIIIKRGIFREFDMI